MNLTAPKHHRSTSQVFRLCLSLTILVTGSVNLLTETSSTVAPKPAVVESRLMGADEHEGPIASALPAAANFAASAIAVRHWGKPVLTIHVTPSINDNKSPEQVIAAVSKGLELWNGRFKAVTLKLTDASDADVEIGFVAAGSLPGGAVGKTDTQFDPDTEEISRANIRVNERMPYAQLVQAIGHEMGHALGIQGHSDNKNDLMYPYAHLPVEVTDRDLNTLCTGYAGNTAIAQR